jgi:hypothetical protein
LPGGFGQDLGHGAFEAGVVVADGQADAVQAALFQPEQELAPTGGAFAGGQFDAEDAAAAFPVDPDGHEDGPAADDAVFAHLLVAGVEDEVGMFGFEALAGEAFELGVEGGVEFADGAGAELVAAELLADGLDFPGGDALDIHFDEGGHEGLLAALVAAEDLGAEAALPVLRDAQFEGAHAGDELARVVAAAVAEAAGAAFALGGS